MKFLFYFSLFFILYTYIGYPLLISMLAKLLQRRVRKSSMLPEPLVSVVIAARDEEECIGRKIETLFGQNYPPEKLEIIIVSDGSTDRTNTIVESLAAGDTTTIAFADRRNPRLRLIKLNENRGKPHALNAGVAEAHADYIVFADARQEFEPNAVRELIANFNDPKVGSVSGELVFRDDSETDIKAEMGFYWKMEKWIRRTEGEIHSIAGATGAIYAIRRSLFERIPDETILDDVFVPMKIVCRGYRNVFDGRAIAYDIYSPDVEQEKKRKVRTLLGNYQLLWISPEIAWPLKDPIFVQFFSHKIFRLFVPFFFLTLLISSVLVSGFLSRLTLAAIVALILLYLFNRQWSRVPVLRRVSALARAFVMLNSFAVLAFLQAISPGKRKVWR